MSTLQELEKITKKKTKASLSGSLGSTLGAGFNEMGATLNALMGSKSTEKKGLITRQHEQYEKKRIDERND